MNIGPRPVAIVAGILLLVAFATFRSHGEQIPNGTRDEFTIGLWCSPWFTATKTETHEKAATGPGFAMSMSSHVGVEFLSWSWLVFAGAVVLLRLGCRRSTVPDAAPRRA